jgi:hypothetical protein
MENQIHTTLNSASDFSKTVKTQINVLLNLSKQELNGNEFYARFTQSFCEIIDDANVLIWQVFQEHVGLLATYPSRKSGTPETGEIGAQHLVSLKSTLNADQPIVYPIASGDLRVSLSPGGDSNDSSSTKFTSILYRLIHDGKSAVVLEVLCDSVHVDKKQATIKRILPAFQEIAQDYHRNGELITLRKKSQSDNRLFEFAKLLCTDFDSNRIAFEIANSAVRILEIDRAAVALLTNGKLNLIAASGVSVVDRNSNATARVLQMVRKAIDSKLPFIESSVMENSVDANDENRDNVPTKAKTTAKPFAVYSLTGDGTESRNPDGALPKNQTLLFLESDSVARIEQLDSNALDRFIELACLRVKQSIHEFKRKNWFARVSGDWFRSRAAIGCISTALVLLVLAIFPAQLKIRAMGQVVPVNQRGVYSPIDGDIVEVLVNHDDHVKVGDPLVRVDSSDLDFEIAKLLGENKATIEKLQAIESRQINNPNRVTNSNSDVDTLSTSVVELKIMKESQMAQINILKKQKRNLTVRSPIEGRVITWQLEKLLDARRVRQGQLLMTVADTDGKWHGELEINDTRIGHVLNAIKTSDNPVSVSCVFVSNPDLGSHGKIISIDQSTKENLIGTPVVNAIADFDFPLTLEQRPGAKILANIHCGTRSLGYVWFHELIDTVRASFF